MTLEEKKRTFFTELRTVSSEVPEKILEYFWEHYVLPEIVLHEDGSVCDDWPPCCDEDCECCEMMDRLLRGTFE